MSYFPPPPGQGGAPLPPPPGSPAPPATHYYPPPSGQIQYRQAPSHQTPPGYGGYMPAPAHPAARSLTPQPPASPYPPPASPQPSHAGTWQQPPQQQAHVPQAYPVQQYAPPPAAPYQPTPGAAAPQMPPPPGVHPNGPGQPSPFQPFQNVYSNINNQVLSSVQEIKNKARSKFSQYLMQPGQQQQSSQFSGHGRSSSQSSSRPVSGHSMASHGSVGFPAPAQQQHHHPQAGQYHQYGVPHAASPPPVQTSSPQQYGQFAPPPPPQQQQGYQHPQGPVRTASYPTYQLPAPHAHASPPMSQSVGASPGSQMMPSPSPSCPGAVPAQTAGPSDYFAVPNAHPAAVVSSRPVSRQFHEAQLPQELPHPSPSRTPTATQHGGYSTTAGMSNVNPAETSQPRLVRTASGSYRVLPQGSEIPPQVPQQTYHQPPQPPAAAESYASGHQEPQRVANQGHPNLAATAHEECPPAYVAVETHDAPAAEPPAPQANQPAAEAPRTDPSVEGISSRLGSVTLRHAPAPDPTELTLEDEDFHDWKRPVPTITDDGEPNAVIWECPEKRVIDYESDWYRLPDVPGFLVCTRCHERYLSGTPLSSSFERVPLPTGRCRFNVPRVTRCLLPEYARTNDARPLRAFMARRLQVQDCHGEAGASGAAGVRWFKVLDGRLEGVVACEACHEDVVLGTSFSARFAAHDRVQPADATWACDVCLPFLGRSLVKHARQPQYTWDDWAQGAAKHLALPRCDGKPVEPASRRWLRLRGGPAGILFCERCYEESLAFTPLGLDFELVEVEPSRTGLGWMDVALGYAAKEPPPMQCSAPSPPVLVATALAKSRRDAGVLREAAEVIAACPPCAEAGITDGAWYTLAGAGGCEGYMLCAACHACYVRAWGLEGLFRRVTGLDSSVAYLCSFQRSAPRWLGHMVKMQEGVETGAWRRYEGWVRRFSGVPECAREEQVGGRRWRGWDDCTICAECWLTFCKETLASAPAGTAKGLDMEFEDGGRLVAETRMCCMYSPRMRQLWSAAVEAGSSSALLEFSRQRHGVYVRTVLQVKMLRGMQEMQMMNAMHAGMMSVTYQGIESMRVVSGTTDGYEHGSAALGWHATDEGATAAAFRNQMSSGMSQANSASTWVQIAQLTTEWKEYE